jgi:hypothetical protein
MGPPGGGTGPPASQLLASTDSAVLQLTAHLPVFLQQAAAAKTIL